MVEHVYAKVSFYSPNCGPWSTLAALHPKRTRENNRSAEIPTLEWISNRAIDRHQRNQLSSIVENPLRTAIYDSSPLSKLLKHPQSRTLSLDQCQFGAFQVGTGLPVRKSTKLLSIGITLRQTLQRCTHPYQCEAHATLLNHDSKGFAVYPPGMCAAIIHDVAAHLSPYQVMK